MGSGVSQPEAGERSPEEIALYEKRKAEYEAKKEGGASEEELAEAMKTYTAEIEELRAAEAADEAAKVEAAAKRGRSKGVSAESSDAALENFEKKVIPKSDEARDVIKRSVVDNFLFSNLASEQLEDVVNAMFEKTVKAGETIITQDEDGDYFYVITEGTFDAYTTKAGDTPVYTYKGQGSFGELALMYNCPRAATVKATSDGTLWVMDRATFRAIILTANRDKAEAMQAFLGKVELLASLSEGEKGQIADALMKHKYADGEVVFSQGDNNRGDMKFYLVESGTAVVSYQRDESSPVAVLKEIETGGYFGERALITNEPRFASVKAKGDLALASMDYATFERLMGPLVDAMKKAITEYPVPEGAAAPAAAAEADPAAADAGATATEAATEAAAAE